MRTLEITRARSWTLIARQTGATLVLIGLNLVFFNPVSRKVSFGLLLGGAVLAFIARKGGVTTPVLVLSTEGIRMSDGLLVRWAEIDEVGVGRQSRERLVGIRLLQEDASRVLLGRDPDILTPRQKAWAATMKEEIRATRASVGWDFIVREDELRRSPAKVVAQINEFREAVQQAP